MFGDAPSNNYLIRMGDTATSDMEPANRSAETPEERQSRLVGEFQNRLAWIVRSYRNCVEQRNARLNFNETIAAAKQSLNPRARSKPKRKRVDPEFEFATNFKARERANERAPDATALSPEDVNAAAQELVDKLKPRRGRPSDPILVHHIQAMMALHRQTCGKNVRASLTRNSVYDPHIHGGFGEVWVQFFHEINPAVTMTTLVNIILETHASKTIIGKRFQDFFPFYGGSIDPETGIPQPGPGYRLEKFTPIAPIYSS
jgi:hypothetical protein